MDQLAFRGVTGIKQYSNVSNIAIGYDEKVLGQYPPQGHTTVDKYQSVGFLLWGEKNRTHY